MGVVDRFPDLDLCCAGQQGSQQDMVSGSYGTGMVTTDESKRGAGGGGGGAYNSTSTQVQPICWSEVVQDCWW
jgi:hypothetical protein